MKPLYKAVIIDDERRPRKALAQLLSKYDNIENCGEAVNADDGIALIRKQNPDIIFLDIQMPRKSGFEMLEELETDASIIFVTAYDQYAIRAFEVNATDYLLKPVLAERLEQTLRRVTGTTPPARKQQLGPDDSIQIHTNRKTIFRDVAGLLAIQSDGDYTRLLFEDQEYLVNQTMTEWESHLPPELFHRIDRTLIINHRQIAELTVKSRNQAMLHLKGCNTVFQLGRPAMKRVKQLLT